MGSVLPIEFRRKHRAKWYLTKTITILALLTLIVLYYTYINPLEVHEMDAHKGESRQELRNVKQVAVAGGGKRRLLSATSSTTPAATTLSSPNLFSSFINTDKTFFTTNVVEEDTSTSTASMDVDFANMIADEMMNDYASLGTNDTFPYANLTSCHIKVVPWADRCEFVQKHSECQGNRYLKWQYCGFKRKGQAPYYILAILYLLILFYLLGDTAEAYFSPALIKISDYLRLSPNVAGVTLLALGNGAPDLSSIIVGVLSGNASIGVGAPIGGGMFVSSVVLGAVILFADVSVTRRPFIRDVGFYFVSVCFVFSWFLKNKVYIWESILCLVLYITYVATVIIGRMIYQRLKRRRLARRERELEKNGPAPNTPSKKKKSRVQQIKDEHLSERLLDREDSDEVESEYLSREDTDSAFGKEIESESDDDSDDENEVWAMRGKWKRQPSFLLYDKAVSHMSSVQLLDTETKAKESEQEVEMDQYEIEKQKIAKMKRRLDFGKSMAYIPNVGIIQRVKNDSPFKTQAMVIHDYMGNQHSEKASEEQKDGTDGTNVPIHPFKRQLLEVYESTGWKELKWYQRITFVLFEAVLIFARNLTIPKADPEEWNKWFASLIPLFAPLLFLVAINQFTYLINKVFPLAVIVAICGFMVSIVVYATTRTDRPPIYQPLLVFMAFGMSIVWIYLVANELLNVLEALGNAWNINKSVLALTVLSWGNSIGDMISDIVIAKQGFPSMAVGACLGAPMLNLLLGLGISMTFVPDQLKHKCFDLQPEPPVAVAFIFLLFSLLSSLVIIPVCKFKGKKIYGVYLFGLYVLYLLLAVLAALVTPINKAFTWRLGGACPKRN